MNNMYRWFLQIIFRKFEGKSFIIFCIPAIPFIPIKVVTGGHSIQVPLDSPSD